MIRPTLRFSIVATFACAFAAGCTAHRKEPVARALSHPAGGVAIVREILSPGFQLQTENEYHLSVNDEDGKRIFNILLGAGGEVREHPPLLQADQGSAAKDSRSSFRFADLAMKSEASVSITITEEVSQTVDPDGVISTQQVLEGWAVFAGANPVGRGRRVRVHGSGTRFIIDSTTAPAGVVERVFFVPELGSKVFVQLDNESRAMRGSQPQYVDVLDGQTLSEPANVPPSGEIRNFYDYVISRAKSANLF